MTARGPAISLIGFMGTGKSSTGRELARRTGRRCFETDAIVVAQLGMTINEIFSNLGEETFRDAEAAALRTIPYDDNCIVVTGGGIVLRPANRELIRELGRVVNLTADEETIYERISRRADRPLLRTDDPRATIARLMAERQQLYASAADITLDTSGLTPAQITVEILSLIERGDAASIEGKT
ncbi:MAG: shikimate kinase [Chthoniobacterales bacterium]